MGYSAMLRSGHHGQVMLKSGGGKKNGNGTKKTETGQKKHGDKNKNETGDRTKIFFCVFVFRLREVGPLNPEKRGPKGGAPKPRKMELQRMGPRRVGDQNFVFFFPLPPNFSKRAHLRVPAFKKPIKIPLEDPQKR